MTGVLADMTLETANPLDMELPLVEEELETLTIYMVQKGLLYDETSCCD